jgi:hypothetical protein
VSIAASCCSLCWKKRFVNKFFDVKSITNGNLRVFIEQLYFFHALLRYCENEEMGRKLKKAFYGVLGRSGVLAVTGIFTFAEIIEQDLDFRIKFSHIIYNIVLLSF